jgi:predicted dehydrogenase
MNDINRRFFIKQAGAAAVAAGTSTAGRDAMLRAAGASERVGLGVIGCERGRYVAHAFAKLNARVMYVCDPDEARAGRARKELAADHVVADLRRVLDDKAVDAVVIAAPDHWHAPAAILACEAGKHVYVEKPCSHNIREGRLMVEAARRANRVMQVGSQSRSTAVLKDGIQAVREGAIGEVLVAKAWNSQRRANIGHARPSAPPPGFDYDLWVGPASMRPFRANCHHYTWHWWYDFGTGDVGNDGIHELDLAVWGLGVEGHPRHVAGLGSKMAFDDDQQFPDTQYVTFEFPRVGKRHALLVYEQRIWSPYTQQGFENGVAFYGTGGYMILSKDEGWRIFGEKDRLIRAVQGAYSVPEHAADFLDAVRSGRSPSADIEVGHRSATLAHLANILARTGRPSLAFDPAKEQVLDDSEADALTRRIYRDGHWAAPKGV